MGGFSNWKHSDSVRAELCGMVCVCVCGWLCCSDISLHNESCVSPECRFKSPAVVAFFFFF